MNCPVSLRRSGAKATSQETCQSIHIKHPRVLGFWNMKNKRKLLPRKNNAHGILFSTAFYSILFYFFVTTNVSAQFCGGPGSLGSSAIHKDSSVFIDWATDCVVTRGYQDIAVAGAFADSGTDTNGIHKADNATVSLGDGGSAIITFSVPIINGSGFDFAIFENGFADQFLELAFVEVSSDGINYVRFDATSNTQTETQTGAFDLTGDPTLLNNLAGKYRVNFGTPFDLQELDGEANLDINAITHIKIIDVVGAIISPYATYDMNSNPINDPYPTAFASSGFDLDAIGVIHQLGEQTYELSTLDNSIHVYPNPVNELLFVTSNQVQIQEILISDVSGKVIVRSSESVISLTNLQEGVYMVQIIVPNGEFITKKIVKFI